MSGVSPDPKRRVKLYALSSSRQWDDKGTGHVSSVYHEPLDGISLLVRNESDGSLLLESKIQNDTQYQKQQGTLIVWTESDNHDLALSFQEQDGCNEIWQKICQVQGRDPSYDEEEEVRIDLVECDQDKLDLMLEQITAYSQTTKRRDALAAKYIENDYIPRVLEMFRQAEETQDSTTLFKLNEIFKQLFLYDRPTLTETMLSEQNLMDVIGVLEYEPPQEQQAELQHDQSHQQQHQLEFELQAEQSQPEAQLESNEHQEQMPQQDEEEEQPLEQPLEQPQEHPQEQPQEQPQEKPQEQPQEQPQPQPQEQPQEQEKPSTQLDQLIEKQSPQQLGEPQFKRHREYLLNKTTFKEVIPFNNQKLVDKIHQTYRMQYLQSSVLPSPSLLEENAYASLTNILFFSKVEIVTMIQEDRAFLQSLFNQIISNETGLERKRELLLFLREYCIFSQTIQLKQRESFFKTLASLKILSAVEVALSSSDQVIKSAAIDIFTYLVEYNPNMTREHAVQQDTREEALETSNNNAQPGNLLKSVIEHITTDQDPELGMATQLSCIIRLLLDPENMPNDVLSKHSFLDSFYYSCMQSIVEPIKASTTPEGDIEPSANDRRTAQLLSIMLELLTFFVEHHSDQLRDYFASSDLLTRIVSLIKTRHKFLVLSVVRFFRRLVATKDNDYLELLMDGALFGPIIQVLKNNNGRYNLIDSAILEMFELIRKENLFKLMEHVLTSFGPFLESIDYVDTFKVMREKKDAACEDDEIEPQFKKMKTDY